MQIGVSAIVISFMYGLLCLLDGFEKDGREQIERQRNARRRTTQERVAALEQLSVKPLPLLSLALKGIEHAFLKPRGGIVKGSSSVQLSRQRFTKKTDETKFFPVDDTEFRYVPVSIALEEEIVQ